MASPKKEQYRSSYLLFFPLLFIVLILEIVRLPAAASQYRPDILGVMLIFFAMTDPKRINVGMAWISGLLLDILSGAPFGVNGLRVAFEVFMVISQFKRFPSFMLWQQMVIIGIVNMIGSVGVYWICNLIGQAGYNEFFGGSSIVTMLSWPLMLFVGAFLWRLFKISEASSKKEKEI